MQQINFQTLKPACYLRKSSESEDKQMLSISSQEEENNKTAQFYKLSPFVDVFQESKSAKNEFARVEFSRMMSLIETGKIDAIVCWKLDRLARNMTEGGKIIDLLSSGRLRAIITHDKVFYPWDNVLVMSVEFGQGKQFVKDLSINVKRGQTKKASMGIPHGLAALGFANDRTEEKGNRRWLIDELRLEKIKTLLHMFLDGTWSAGKLYDYANEALHLTTPKHKRIGGNPITKSRIYEILKDPIYAGYFYYGGERYELDKSLPRLITEAQHNRIKELLGRSHTPRTQCHEMAFSGFISAPDGSHIGQDVKYQLVCDCKKKFAFRNRTHCPGCGAEICSLENPKYRTYAFYYNVRKKKAGAAYKSIREDEINDYLKEYLVENLALPRELVDWSKKYIHELKDQELNHQLLISRSRDERKAQYENEKAKVRKMCRNELITETEMRTDLAALEQEYADIHSEYTAPDWHSRLMEITDITAEIKEVFENGSVRAKRKILAALGSNLIWNDKELSIINTKEIDTLINGIKAVKSKINKFELSELEDCLDKKEKTDRFQPVLSTLLRRQDSNLRPIRYSCSLLS